MKTSAFHSLSRVISLSVGFSACLDFLQKTKSSDQNQIIAIKFVAFVMFLSLACSVRMLLSLKVARQVQLKCGDPIRNVFPKQTSTSKRFWAFGNEK